VHTIADRHRHLVARHRYHLLLAVARLWEILLVHGLILNHIIVSHSVSVAITEARLVWVRVGRVQEGEESWMLEVLLVCLFRAACFVLFLVPFVLLIMYTLAFFHQSR
jgi:hypothetical protein